MRTRSLALLAALAACTAGPAPYREDASGPDVVEEEFSLCAVPCAAGQVCRGFRCVAVVDAAVSRDVASDIVACCPMDPAPSCGCVALGGARLADGTCRRVCGRGFHQLWFRTTDFEGCPVWSPSVGTCADAGADARDDVTLASDAAGMDAR